MREFKLPIKYENILIRFHISRWWVDEPTSIKKSCFSSLSVSERTTAQWHQHWLGEKTEETICKVKLPCVLQFGTWQTEYGTMSERWNDQGISLRIGPVGERQPTLWGLHDGMMGLFLIQIDDEFIQEQRQCQCPWRSSECEVKSIYLIM